jgi:hypothetical protein
MSPPYDLTCPICDMKAKPLDDIGEYTGFECANDGRFRVARSVFATTALVEAPKQKWKDALRRARERQPGEWAPTIKTDDF